MNGVGFLWYWQTPATSLDLLDHPVRLYLFGAVLFRLLVFDGFLCLLLLVVDLNVFLLLVPMLKEDSLWFLSFSFECTIVNS